MKIHSENQEFKVDEHCANEGCDEQHLDICAEAKDSVKASVKYSMSLEIAGVERLPDVPSTLLRPVKRRRTRIRIAVGLTFLACIVSVCVYYYSHITAHLSVITGQFLPLSTAASSATDDSHPESEFADDDDAEDREILDANFEDEGETLTNGVMSSFYSSLRFSNQKKNDASDGVLGRRPSSENSRSMTSSSSTIRRGPSGSDAEVKDGNESPRELDGDPLPMGDMLFQNNQMHASEALQCRESVKNFVVNATDGKDECDGLIKAYDKTCSGNEPSPNHSHRHLEQYSKSGRARRRLWDKLNVPYVVRWNALTFQTARAMKRQFQYFSSLFVKTTGPMDDINAVSFFAEDAVLSAWNDALYIVEHKLDNILQSDARRLMHEGQCIVHRKEQEEIRTRRRLQTDTSTSNDSNSFATLSPLPSPTDKQTTTTHLQLPIRSQEHLSEKFTNDALLLQQPEAILKAVDESTVAKEEAAKSKKSISDTSDLVNSVLSDPSSKEAITCCSSILNVYHELCSTDVEEQVSDTRLFFLVFVLACCGMVKSLIRHFKILWLPEAAGCIMVGVISGYVLEVFPHHDVSFDGNWFLRILVPPIIFQAALSIDKRSFNRHIVPILMFAIAGTLMATVLTAVIVHYGTTVLSRWCEPIPYVEALTFGALISSIDPIAVLSVLSNMGMNDTDTIYVLIFGESLLNDGVAIVLFHTLVHFLDESLIIDREAIAAAAVHFFVVAFGSLIVGVASGIMSTVYFWAFHGCQTPLVEVLMFMCWALLPYYVCDGIGWSGIVAAVAVGFFMDLHIVGQHRVVEDEGAIFDVSDRTSTSYDSNGDFRPKSSDRGRRQIFNRYGHLSGEAKAHVGFVTEIVATGMETAIFAYLGFFLFSHRYHWNVIHMILAIIGCCCSRAIMIPALSLIANGITRVQQSRGFCRSTSTSPLWKANNLAGVIVDKKMQVALWFAGLRGAMSFALVESIPLYDSFSGEGTRLKPELKAMTSACIMFTVFILGGYTYYILDRLGISPNNRRSSPGGNGYEIAALISKGHDFHSDEDGTDRTENDKFDTAKTIAPGSAFRRQRHTSTQGDAMLTI